MKIINEKITLQTRGNPDLLDITGEITVVLEGSGLKKGNLLVFLVGSTAAITTFEYEPGLIQDMQDLYERFIPASKRYHHDDTWGDANAFSHMRAAVQGPSLTIPFDQGKLLLGTWQQVVLAEFDHCPRERQIIIQIIGE